jgi:ABC-type antimicrobial peptide transport system permease subunit
MFKTYCKIILRNLWKYKSHTIINVLGMGIGIASMVWGFQTYRYSFSFDSFHKHQDDVYRALIYKKDEAGLKGIFPMAAVRQAQHEFPGIKAAVRYDLRYINIRQDTSEAFSETVHFADPEFFDIFDFPLIAGSHDLKDPSAVLITEKIAKKYFAGQNPVGKTLTFYTGETYQRSFTVKGLLKDLPVNSTIHFNIITQFDNMVRSDGKKIVPDDWGWFLYAAFFYVPDPAAASRLEKEMVKYLPLQNKARQDAKVSGFRLVTLRQNASWSHVISSNGLYERPDDAAAYGPFVLAFLIFLSSCLNFSNTTVARAGTRLKEIGMRKVMGSTYRQLIFQLLAECAVIVVFATALSVAINNWWLPVFNSMFQGVDVRAEYFQDPVLLLFILVMLLAATLMAGAYPSFYLSRFSPTSIFRGSVRFGGSNLFSRLMLGMQLCIAIITVTAGIAFAKNSEFQRNFDYGYSVDGSMGVNLNDSSDFVSLKNELSYIPGIDGLSGTRDHIGYASRDAVADANGIKKEVDLLEIGRGYLQTMQLKLIAGREFDPAMESDYINALIISEKLASLYQWTPAGAIGKRVHIDSVYYSVVGVLRDFHSENLFEPMRPTAMKLGRENRYRLLVIRASPANLTGVYQKVREVWKRIRPSKPFTGFYQNQIKTEALEANKSIATIFFWFALVSVFLTATGLFALVSLTTMKKMKEIALRKVVGAGGRDITVLIGKSYFWIFILSAILGCYGGWSLTKLLLDLIFKINVGVGPGSLLWSVITLFAIAMVVSGIKVWEAIHANPVKLLRNE